MEFPEKFNKFYWWIALIISLAIILFIRRNSIINGTTTPMDIVIFLVFIALLLVPIFEEINIFGIKLKREIEDIKTSVTGVKSNITGVKSDVLGVKTDLTGVKTNVTEVKTELTGQILNLRTDVQNSINIKNEANQQNIIYTSFPDSQVQQREQYSRKVLEDAKKVYNLEDISLEIDAPDDVKYLFSVRYGIEKEVRSIWIHELGEDYDEESVLKVSKSTNRMIHDLLRYEIISPKYARVISDVYSICSLAIHGRDVSLSKYNYVQDIAPELISFLKSIK
ncbi:MAG: hypothetical protein K8E24_009310 [Methanobacterium paludis]|nr:hypothetical protein [Methanobacterium paludis]